MAVATPVYRYDPHVILGRCGAGKQVLWAGNLSGELWRQEWVKKDDGYWCYHIGPFGRTEGPLTYEEAYKRVKETVGVLRNMSESTAPSQMRGGHVA